MAITDPTSPDFPHGTPLGYERGCRIDGRRTCPAPVACIDSYIARSRSYCGRPPLDGVPDTAHVDAGPAREHLRRLLRADLGLTAIGAAADISTPTLRRLLRSDVAHTRHQVDRQVRNLTVSRVSEFASTRPVGRYAEHTYALVALGWPTRWQMAQVCGDRWLRPDRRTIRARTADNIDRLFARIGFRAPVPGEYGLREADIAAARRLGASRGFVPPRPDDRYRWAALHSVVLGGRSQQAVADQFRLPGPENVARWCARIGLHVDWARQEFGTISRHLVWESAPVADYVTATLKTMDVDPAALMRGTWSVLDINPAFDASTAWAQVRAVADDHSPVAGQAEQAA